MSASGTHDRVVEPAGGQLGVRLALGAQVDAEGVVARVVGVGVDAADHHVAADAGGLGGRDQLDGAAEVHRALALRAAAGPGAGREDDGVGAPDGVGHEGVVGLFEVADDGVAAGVADVVRVVGVADQRADLVSALGEQPREPQRDLPVSSCDRDKHASHHTAAVVPSRSWRYHAHRLVFRHLGIPPGTMRPYALPGAARLHELRWRRRLARAPVTDYASHAAAVGVGEIEEPIPCSLCGGERVQALFRTKGYAVVRCVECGLLYRNPGIRPERLGDLYAGHYSRFLTGVVREGPAAPLPAGHGRLRPAVRRRLRPPAARLRLRRRAVPGPGLRARVRVLRRRPVGGLGREGAPSGRAARTRTSARRPTCRRSPPAGSTW